MSSRGAFLLKACVLAAAFLLTAWIVGVGLVDDTYIFLRYARHVAGGLGPVFNVGDRVEGYTSPLWLGMLVPLFSLRAEPSSLAMALGATVGFASVLVIVWHRPFWNALVLATNPAYVFWSFSGMDTALTALLLTLAFVAFFPGTDRPVRLVRGGTWLALAVLARPDCAWFLPLAFVRAFYCAGQDRYTGIRNVAAVASPLLLVVVHLLWRHAYYGSWLPNTYFTKVGVDLSARLPNGAAYILAASTNLLPLGALYVVTTSEYRRPVGVLILMWMLFAIAVGGDFFPYYRLIVPLLPIIVFGIGALQWSGSVRLPGPKVLPVAGVFMVLANLGLFLGREHVAAQLEIQMPSGWAAVGNALGRILPRDAKIATLSAGAIPYYSEREVIDLLGLTDAQIGRYGRVYGPAAIGHQRYDTDYVLDQHPDVVVLPESGRAFRAGDEQDTWPHYAGPDLRYGYALADLVNRPETKQLYVPHKMRLDDGRLLWALWRKN